MNNDHDHRVGSDPPEPEQDWAPAGHVDDPGEAVILPDDAGPHAAALETILRRIPPRWGRWIDIGPGWYPLIVDTDARLAALNSDYIVHQIKEKYGTLRYYCTPSGEEPDPELSDAFDAITDDAEHVSGLTCQRCGQPGTPQRTQHRVETLCGACRDTL